MPIRCHYCPLRELSCFVPLSDSEIRDMDKMKVGELVVDAGTPLLMQGSNAPQLFTVLKGMGLRYKTLANGERQVLNFALPGDFLGLQAGIMGAMQHSVEATTEMTLCVFDRQALWTLFRTSPERAYDVTWLAALEEHFLGEALLSIGQRSAAERMAWALYRLFARLTELGMGNGNSVPLPYRQQDLADALGLSLVHTNKTLAKLRASGVASWSNGRLSVNNREALAEAAGLTEDDHPLPKRPIM
ncbi:MAG: Crp/Fnr family transcriptional regulator [Mangrovicoccus sp.]